MAFCSNCGQPLAEGAKFCASCGTPVGGAANDGSKRVQKFDGEIHKCPNCGAQLPSMAVRCPECGFELRGVKNTSAATELKKLIDSVKPVYYKDGDLDEEETNLRKNKAIKTFVIPNSAEDMLELMTYAVSYMKICKEDFEYYDWDSMPDEQASAGYIYIMESVKNKLSVVSGLSPQAVEHISKLYDDTKSWAKSATKNHRKKEKSNERKEIFMPLLRAIILIAIIVVAHILHLPFLLKWGLTVVLGIIALVSLWFSLLCAMCYGD